MQGPEDQQRRPVVVDIVMDAPEVQKARDARTARMVTGVLGWLILTLFVGATLLSRVDGGPSLWDVFFQNLVYCAIISVVIVMVAALVLWHRSRQWIDLHVTGIELSQVEKAVHHALTRAPADRRYLFRRVHDELVLRGHAGVLRFARRVTLTPITPLDIPFEPQPLDEADEKLLELMAVLMPHDDAGRAAQTKLARSPLRRRMSSIRVARGPAVAFAVSTLAVTAQIARMIAQAVRTGNVAPGDMIFWPALLFVLYLMLPRSAWLSQTQWFVVPGGLVIRTAGRGSSAVHLFRRDESILIALQNVAGTIDIAVADAQRREIFAATPLEADFLLAAWLSKTEPPTREQLSDLV